MDRNDIDSLLQKSEDHVVMIGSYNKAFVLKNSENLGFSIDPLCEEPFFVQENNRVFKESYIVNGHYFTMVNEQKRGLGIPEWFNALNYKKQESMDELTRFYEERFIIYLPVYKFRSTDDAYHKNVYVVDSIPTTKYLPLNTRFKVVPKVNMDNKAFEKKILSGGYFHLENYPGDIYDSIDYIMCGNCLYLSDGWLFNTGDTFKWCKGEGKNVLKFELPDKLSVVESSSKYARDTAFIDAAYLQEYSEYFEELTIVNEPVSSAIEDDVVIVNEEFEMLEYFRASMIKNNLCYDYEDLINLHTCAKSLPLVIIAGMSGVGKTQLVLQYAKMLDASEVEKSFLFMPVSPAYSEPDDVLGYYSLREKRYIPSDTGLVEFLVHAQDNPDKMHVVLFDEMNLSQIEYWFSSFMSVLEKGSDERYLTLYNPIFKCDSYPARVKINNNVIFFGTVNLDETTKTISDRLLDRSFVVNLKKKSFVDFYDQDKNQVVEVKKVICDSVALFSNWRNKKQALHAFSKEELEFFDDLHRIISLYDEQKGVSYRVLRNIGTYMNNIPVDDHQVKMISRDVAFDLILKQTVMKKITGPDMRLLPLVGSVRAIGDEVRNSMILQLFDKYSSISSFSECRQSVRRKAEDLLTYGYAR